MFYFCIFALGWVCHVHQLNGRIEPRKYDIHWPLPSKTFYFSKALDKVILYHLILLLFPLKPFPNTLNSWSLRKIVWHHISPQCPILSHLLKSVILLISGPCPTFTWSNKRDFSELSKARLDKCLSNSPWGKAHPNAMVLVNPIHLFNHSAFILDSNLSFEKSTPTFKIRSFWFSQESCLQLIRYFWKSAPQF